jgi:hypothetical protein
MDAADLRVCAGRPLPGRGSSRREIEDLLERVPYKKVNEVMRYALCWAQDLVEHKRARPGYFQCAKHAHAQTPQTAQQPAWNFGRGQTGPQYSQAAQNMFDTFGTKLKSPFTTSSPCSTNRPEPHRLCS